ncbi:MAG TPA: hypothetical protein VIO94_15940 [Phenylobacterium sp.]
MEDTQTPPTGEQVEVAQTPLSDILSGAAADTGEGSGLEAEVQPEPQQQEPAPAPVTADPAPKAEEPQHPFWYRKEIEKERKARQAAERRAAELEAQRTQPRQEGPAPTHPDPLEDPAAYNNFIEARFERQRLVDRLERSEDRLIDKLGEDVFEETREWLATRPDIEEWALKQRDPWKAAHGQFQKERLAAEIGEDPNAWREAERERIRAELQAEMSARQPAAASAPNMRPPPPAPASDARGSAPRDAAGRFTGPTPMSDILGSRGR